MAIINYAAREMTAKIVYYGPGLSGKTTSIQVIHDKISPANKGKLVSLATETDRTLFFDFFPVDFGKIGGFKVKFNFYTVPGQVFYNTTRKLVLKGADGVVFVADSQKGMKDQNLESLDNLKHNLKAHGLDIEAMPFVIQYNKRDLPEVMSIDEMRLDLNSRSVPEFETSAFTGQGIMDAMKVICKLSLEELQNKQRNGSRPAAQRPSVAAQPQQPEQATPVPKPQRPIQPQKVDSSGPVTPPAQKRAPIGGAPAVERSILVPVKGPGEASIGVNLPLDLTIEEGVESVQIAVRVQVNYLTHGKGTVKAQEIAAAAEYGEGERETDDESLAAAIESEEEVETAADETAEKDTVVADEAGEEDYDDTGEREEEYPEEKPEKRGIFGRFFKG